MPYRAVGGAGIGDEGDEIAEIATVAHRALDALVGDDARYHQMARAEVAQHVIDVGRDEDIRGGLGNDHFIWPGGEGVDHLAVPTVRTHVEAGDLVVEAAVPALAAQLPA